MPAEGSLFQEVYQQIQTVVGSSGARVRKTTLRRLALLVTGIIAAQAVTLAKIADELLSLKLTRATEAESLERTLERILSDEKLEPRVWFEPALVRAIDWEQLLAGSKRVVLAVDESSDEDRIHLFRIGLPYWGHCLPLAWDLWAQNQPLSRDASYWSRVEAVLGRVAALLPPGLEVIVLADRAYDLPGFIDRVNALGWHWVVRYKANGDGRFRDRLGREWVLGELVAKRVGTPGKRWKARGSVYKKAGWRQASVVATWELGQKEPLVVISDQPARWQLLRLYGVRFWVEPGFRSDKKLGWHWEDSQVRSLAHHQRLVLGMAWATLVTLCIGLQEAKERLAKLSRRPLRVRADKPVFGKPRAADQSLFTMGLRRTRDWLYHTTDRAIHWLLSDLGTVSWHQLWYNHQSHRLLAQTVRP